MLDKFQSNAGNLQISNAGGCIAIGAERNFAPAAIHTLSGQEEGIEINLLGTAVADGAG